MEGRAATAAAKKRVSKLQEMQTTRVSQGLRQSDMMPTRNRPTPELIPAMPV